jgi:hypothetical protein
VITTAIVLLLAAGVLPRPARAQEEPSTAQAPPAAAPRRTVLTDPTEAVLTIHGETEVGGTSPIEMDPHWTGKYAITIEAAGYSTARGKVYFPEDASSPTLASEPPGLSPGLFLRSLNFPGVPALMSGHRRRGLALLTAGVGGVAAVVRDQLEYRSKLKKTDAESQFRARDFRYARGRWQVYTAGVWGMSALDYMIRSRMDLLEATPTRVRVGAPKLARINVVWRSMLVPGAGQDYANHEGRGVVWLSATLLSGAAYFIADESHRRIETKLGRAQDLLETSGPGELADRQADVDHFTSLEKKSKNLLNGLALGTIGIYALNVIDAGIVGTGGSAGERKVSFSAPVSPHGAAVALTYRF